MAVTRSVTEQNAGKSGKADEPVTRCHGARHKRLIHERCEICGQSIQNVREGVLLTPLKARIFDLIRVRPGITRKELCFEVYETVSTAAEYTVGSHIAQIRDRFEGTDVTVKGVGWHGYIIEKDKT